MVKYILGSVIVFAVVAFLVQVVPLGPFGILAAIGVLVLLALALGKWFR